MRNKETRIAAAILFFAYSLFLFFSHRKSYIPHIVMIICVPALLFIDWVLSNKGKDQQH